MFLYKMFVMNECFFMTECLFYEWMFFMNECFIWVMTKDCSQSHPETWDLIEPNLWVGQPIYSVVSKIFFSNKIPCDIVSIFQIRKNNQNPFTHSKVMTKFCSQSQPETWDLNENQFIKTSRPRTDEYRGSVLLFKKWAYRIRVNARSKK